MDPPVLNNTKAYTIKITKYLCVGTPYQRSTLHYCKTVLQRNRPAKLNVSLSVQETLNYVWVTVKLYYKFKTFQPLLIDMEQEGCEYVRNRPIIPLTDYIYDIFKKTVPDLSTPCPHGVSISYIVPSYYQCGNVWISVDELLEIDSRQNRTYTIVWWFEERYTPKSMPAGDYRVDVQFIAQDNVLLFALEAYFAVRRKGVLGSMLEW
ncbi:uncharacterized protein LOC118458258 [Anopheles albimanus]|nr:uncharacterized protein LOC118458258 [Anopheles albimanus]